MSNSLKKQDQTKAGQVAYPEKLSSDKLRTSGIMIQKHIRGWLARSKYVKMKRSALFVQSHTRGMLARRLLKLKLESRAAVCIPSGWRSFVVKLQARCRGYLARNNRELIVLKQKAAARSVEHQKQLNKGLDNSLQQQIENIVSRFTAFNTKLCINI